MTSRLELLLDDKVLALAGVMLLFITVVLTLTVAVTVLTARHDAAARHATWLTGLLCLLAGPPVLIGLDQSGLNWPVPLLPAPSAARAISSAGDRPLERPGALRVQPTSNSTSPSASGRPRAAQPPGPGAMREAVAWNWQGLARIGLLVWGLGVIALLLRLVGGLVALARLRDNCRPVQDACIVTTFDAIVAALGFRTAPRLLVCDRLTSPIAVGIPRPAIILPAGLEGPQAFREILIHEAAHLLRRDPLVGFLQRVAGALFWPHPLVALLNRELARSREEVCDNYVLRHGDRFRYSRALLEVSVRSETGPRSLAAVGLIYPRWNLIDRITGLLDERRIVMLRARPLRGIAVATLLLATGLNVGAVRLVAAHRTEGPVATTVQAAKSETGPITESEIAGRVVDADGKPLEGVLVDAWSWYPGHETHTDKGGHFRLKAFTGPGYDPREGAEMRFSKEGYSPRTFPHESVKGGTADLVVTLTNTTYFEGQVTAPDGKPVAGALIRASNPSRRLDGITIGNYWTETRSDESGHYRLYVSADTFDFQVRRPGTGVARVTGEAIANGEVRRLDLRMSKGVDFRARIVDSQTGEPVPGVRLWNWEQPGIEGRGGPDGVVRIEDMPPGRFAFSVGDDKPFETKRKFESHKLTRWWSEQCLSEWSRKQLFDDRQRYGKWQRNFDDLDFELKPGMGPVTIEVEKGVTIRGRVLDPDGNPVSGATVAPALTGSGNSLTGDTRFSEESGPDGQYELLLPASGEREYNLVAHDGKFLEWRHWANGVIPPFRTRPGEVRENVDISLSRPATVRGRVVDSNGKPVANREVRAAAADMLENRYYDPTIPRSDADGRFELKFIRPGKHHIQVAPFWLSAPGAPKGTSQTIELKAGEPREGIELIAQPDPREARGTP